MDDKAKEVIDLFREFIFKTEGVSSERNDWIIQDSMFLYGLGCVLAYRIPRIPRVLITYSARVSTHNGELYFYRSEQHDQHTWVACAYLARGLWKDIGGFNNLKDAIEYVRANG